MNNKALEDFVKLVFLKTSSCFLLVMVPRRQSQNKCLAIVDGSVFGWGKGGRRKGWSKRRQEAGPIAAAAALRRRREAAKDTVTLGSVFLTKPYILLHFSTRHFNRLKAWSISSIFFTEKFF